MDLQGGLDRVGATTEWVTPGSVGVVSATDVVMIALTVVCLLATGALAVTVVQLRATTTALRRELESFRESAVPAAVDLTDSARAAARQVDRLENLIGVAASVTDTMDQATAATVRVLSSPVIKTAAIAKGTRRAARRLKSAEGS